MCPQPISCADREQPPRLLLGAIIYQDNTCECSLWSIASGLCCFRVAACKCLPDLASGSGRARLKRGRPLKPKQYLVNCPSVWNKLEESQSLSFSSLLLTQRPLRIAKGAIRASSFTSAPLHLFGREWKGGSGVCVYLCVYVYEKRERETERDQKGSLWRIPAILR